MEFQACRLESYSRFYVFIKFFLVSVIPVAMGLVDTRAR